MCTVRAIEVRVRGREDGLSEKNNCVCMLIEEEWQFLQLTEKFSIMSFQMLDSFLSSFPFAVRGSRAG